MHLDLDENPEHNATIGKKATGLFWGEMRLDVKPGYANKIRGGYAGFRNMVRVRFLSEALKRLTVLAKYASFRMYTCAFSWTEQTHHLR